MSRRFAQKCERRKSPCYKKQMNDKDDLKSLSDDELLRCLSNVLAQSRRVEWILVAHIAEVDARRLFAREASPSMFQYAVDVLHLSKAEAYLRIEVARASRRHPTLLTELADGRLHLSGIVKLAPHLTEENRDELLARATHKTKREILELVARLLPGILRGVSDLLGGEPVLTKAADVLDVVSSHHLTQIVVDRIGAVRTDEVDYEEGGLVVEDEAGPNAPPLVVVEE